MLERNAFLLAETEVVGAVKGRGVDDAGALFGGDEVGRDDVVGAAFRRHGVRVERLVIEAHEVAALHALDDFVIAVQDVEPGLREDEALSALADLHVVDVVVDGEGDVSGEGPGRRGPGQDRGSGIVPEPEADVDARVGDVVLVAQGELVAGQRRRAARAVGSHPEALVDEVLVPHALERPPDRLDVVGVVCPVGVVVVLPERHPLGHRPPVAHVLVDALAAEPVELGDAELLDLLLARDAELLLDLQLDGQPVGVPAGLALDVEALHRPVAAEEVLESPGQDVMGPGFAVGRGRSLVEDETLAALARVEARLEGAVLLPGLHDPHLEVREADLAGNLVEHEIPIVGAGLAPALRGRVRACRRSSG